MRKALIALAATLLLPAAGCREAPSSPATSAEHSGAAMPTSPVSSPSDDPSPSGLPSSHGGPPRSHGAPSPATSPPSRGDPENPLDLRGAPIVLTGTIDTTGECVVLTAKGHRWALVRAPIGLYTDGQTATVRGRPTAVPPDCDAEWALSVYPR
ncbi:hypothetical protein ACTOB_003551 [Actinoplanes oblitus]|uniref:Uncharacterized protein n=1 Tax=Actinoplanes oblitus TaxID=3040509 RepID=A0ABY8WTD7_9ACTN|nr:hypothetical protein [Actinoplanes oblitus]WIM99883.1 hypothetical protein ACTOB_003551 [Actinoplanes oblitus]